MVGLLAVATVWRYGEARNPWAAGEPSPPGGPGGTPSSPVARAKRPTMEAANAKAAIRPTFNRTGKATPYAREARASGSRPAGSHMKSAITPMPIAIASPRNPIDRRATSRGETGAPVLLGPGKVPFRFPFLTWTQYTKVPPRKCPSTAETAVQVAV